MWYLWVMDNCRCVSAWQRHNSLTNAIRQKAWNKFQSHAIFDRYFSF